MRSSRETTPLINDRLREEQEKKSSCSKKLSKSLVWLQFAYNLLNTLAKTSYTSAVMITDLAKLEPEYFGMSSTAIGISIPIAVMFAAAESYAHFAESEHFNHAKEDRGDIESLTRRDSSDSFGSQNSLDSLSNVQQPEAAPEETNAAPLTWKQSTCAAVHYLSDIYEGASVPLLFSKMGGIDQAPGWVRGLSYLGMGIYSAVGDAQEYVNTRIAFREANERKLQSSPSRAS